jgi:hypothetical protein
LSQDRLLQMLTAARANNRIGGMWRLVGLVLAGVLGLSAPDALASSPVKGGHYVFVHRLGADILSGGSLSVTLELTLANDGRELATRSGVFENLQCTPTNGLIDGVRLDGVFAPYRAVKLAGDGRFAYRSPAPVGGGRAFALSGGFARGGQLAIGSLSIHGATPCPTFHLAFRAPLIGRPNAVSSAPYSVCDRVLISKVDRLGIEEAYRVYDHDVGCTAAREIARRWRASPTCRQLTTGHQCTVTAATCRAIRGGRFNALSSASCRPSARPHGVAELVHYQPCPPPKTSQGGDVLMWAINLDCQAATAFPVDTLIGDPDNGTGPCGDIFSLDAKSVACNPVAGYVCRARIAYFGPDSGSRARCVEQQDGFRALEFDYDALQ